MRCDARKAWNLIMTIFTIRETKSSLVSYIPDVCIQTEIRK